MKWIGLTGNLGSGKSTVAQLLRELGYEVLDADELSKSTLGAKSPILKDLREKFGDKIFFKDGQLDRKALGREVFSSKENLDWLESKVHPEVRMRVAEKKQALEDSGAKVAFYDVPLLFEKGMDSGFDQVVVVSASESRRKERVLNRDGIDESDFTARSSNQWPMEKKEELAHHVIFNEGTVESLKIKIQDFLKTLVED